MSEKIYTAEELKSMQEVTQAKISQRDTLTGKRDGLIDAVKKNFGVASGDELKAKREAEEVIVADKEVEYERLCVAHREIPGVA